MPERDPFPMTSMEAKALEASVGANAYANANANANDNGNPGGCDRSDSNANANANATSWSTMPLDSGNGAPSSSDIRDGDNRDELDGTKNELLVARKKSVRRDDREDIYTHVDKEVVDEDDEENLADRVLDVPLEELRGDWRKKYKGQAKRAFFRFYRRLYGDKLPVAEMMRTLCLAMTLFFMIGGYWMLRSLKDSVLMALCGYQAIPKAKMLSVFVVLGVVSVYNHLLDSDIAKHQLFYVFGTFYFFLFTVIALMLMNPSIGLANKYQDEGRILGWVSYCAIESFGSVMVSLFWSFANSNISLETAKSSYGVMVAFAQLGSILGPAIVTRYAEEWGIAQCYLLGALNMLLLQGSMYFFIRTYGSNETRAKQEEAEKAVAGGASEPKKKKERAGILEGLTLFWKYNYVKGIFAISCLFMVEVTIVDFTLKVLAKEYFSEEYPCEITNPDCYNAETKGFGLTEEASNAIASFMGLFGVATNSLSFIFSLLGTSAVIRKLGLRLTLLLFPSLCLVVIIVVRLRPTLYIVFLAMILLKANSYALNNPTKEMLYQPTSGAVRYKAKSWIDIFGARGSKALGSVVTNAFSDSAVNLVANGSLVGIAVSCFLIWNARFMGQLFEQYTESGYVVGEEDNPESKNIEMAIEQNEREDTSCALEADEDDDDEEEENGTGESEEKPTTTTKAEITMV